MSFLIKNNHEDVDQVKEIQNPLCLYLNNYKKDDKLIMKRKRCATIYIHVKNSYQKQD